MMVRFAASALTLCASGFVAAADPEVEALLAQMRKAYQSVEAIALQAKSRVRYPAGEESHTVKMEYLRPEKLRLTFDFRGKTIRRVSDGKTVATWAEDLKSGEKSKPDLSKISMDALGGDAPINLESMSFFDWKRQLSTAKGANMEKSAFKLIASEKWNGRDWIVLEESAHGQGVFARYFIDPKTHFIWRCEVRSLDKRQFFMDSQIVNMTLKPKFDADVFRVPFPSPD